MKKIIRTTMIAITLLSISCHDDYEQGTDDSIENTETDFEYSPPGGDVATEGDNDLVTGTQRMRQEIKALEERERFFESELSKPIDFSWILPSEDSIHGDVTELTVDMRTKTQIKQDALAEQAGQDQESYSEARDRIISEAEKRYFDTQATKLLNEEKYEDFADLILWKQSTLNGPISDAHREVAENQLAGYVNKSGIISSFQSKTVHLGQIELSSDPNTRRGRKWRARINQILAKKMATTDPVVQSDLDVALMAAIAADRTENRDSLSYKYNEFLSNRALYKIENDPMWLKAKENVQTAGAAQIVDVSGVVNPLIRSAIISTSNALDKTLTKKMIPLDSNPSLLAAIKLNNAAHIGNEVDGPLKPIYSELNDVFNIIDFVNGTEDGFIAFGKDFITGLGELVEHPIDSLKAIGHAIAECEQTYDLIMDSIEEEYDQIPDYDAGDWDKLSGRIAFEAASLLTGEIGVRASGKLTQITRSVDVVDPVNTRLKVSYSANKFDKPTSKIDPHHN